MSAPNLTSGSIMIGVLLTFAMLSGAPASCPLEQAHYALRGAPGVTAGVRPVAKSADWPVGLAVFVRVDQVGPGAARAPGRTWWFLPYSGNGQGVRGHLASTHDVTAPGWTPPDPDSGRERPLGDLDYMMLDGDYGFLETSIPRTDRAAPAHLLIPDLQQALWYRPPEGERTGVPLAFFDLTACDA